MISKVNSGTMRHVSESGNEKISQYEEVLSTEIDNHADTHFFGKNLLPFSWTALSHLS